MLAMSDDDTRKSPSPQRTKSAISNTINENKQSSQNKNANTQNSVKPNMVYIVSHLNYILICFKH